MITIAYRLLLWVGLPLLLLYTIAIGISAGSLRYILQRLGLRLPIIAEQSLWIHCVSVGELNTALLLLKQWLHKYPDDHILVTTSTTSAAEVFATKADPRMQHCYLPLDYTSLVMRFLRRLKPRAAIMMETEVWFNLFHGCDTLDIPTVIINARLSPRITDANLWVRRYYQHSLTLPKAIYAKSERDREVYMQMGVVPWQIKTVGNLKYATKFDEPLPNLIAKSYILAASTHDNEELQIAEAWQQIAAKDFVLVIAPRHPHRAEKIRRALSKKHIQINYYRSNTTLSDGDMVLYDRIGQLPQLIKHASLVFLGGSLINKGGHNILEAAMLGTPQVTGCYLGNIAEEAYALNKAGGLIIIDNAAALADIFTRVINQPDYYQRNATAAKNYLGQHADIAQHYIAALESLNLQPKKHQ